MGVKTMTCNEARQHWNLYHDSEGDAELHFQINEHLAVCPPCAQWFKQQSRLESLLAEKLSAAPPTTQLWSQLFERTGLVRPRAAQPWLWMTGVAACLAIVGLILFWYWSRPSESLAADLAKLTAARHERLIVQQEPLEFRSQSDLDVEQYLRQRVSFPVRCPPRKDAGFAVQGAGVCRLADQPAAYLSGHVGEAPVSIFVLPRESLAAFPHQHEAVLRDKTHRCREGQYAMALGVIDQNAVLVIGDTDPDRLEGVLRAYGTYPH